MKKLFILSSYLLSVGASVFAQHPAAERLTEQTPTLVKHQNIPMLINPIQTNAQATSNETLVLKTYTESNIGKHYLYQQMHDGLPVYGAYLKVNTNKKGDVLNSSSTLVDISKLNIASGNILNFNYWVVSDNDLLLAKSQQIGHTFTLKQQDGTILYEKDKRLFFTDTIVKARVFNPDPLTTAGVTYGKDGTYRNFNDSDYALLNDQRQWVTFPAQYDNGLFHLKNKYAAITNLRSPNHTPSTSTTDTFDFTRKQIGFKEVMALYHVSQLQNFIQGLGFNNLVNYQLKIDPHSSNADQSFFSYDPDTSLNFGLGGVPDAEDADVIVHEYTHAISHSLNPSDALGTERRAIEEAICDAMCCAYSKRINPFLWKNIFSWDGHNEFWNGRNGASTKTYDNRIGDFYSDSEIWSSAMNNLIEKMGEDALIKLMLSMIPQLAPNSTMPQAAQLMYDTDSIINNSQNRWLLAEEFVNRKLGDFYTGVKELALNENISIYNTFGFANGTAPASIKPNQNGTFDMQLFDINGKLILSKNNINQLELNPQDFGLGMYVLHLTYNGQIGYLKLSRQQ
jgi:uncharacterized protein YxeA